MISPPKLSGWISPENEIINKLGLEKKSVQIQEKEIKSKIDCDVLIIGGGTSGMFAALSSAEKGAATVLIEKGSKGSANAHNMAAINSSLQKKMGIHIDRNLFVAELCRYASHLVDQRIINLWADKSGEVMDWFTSIVESEGMKVVLESDVKEGFYRSFPIAHTAIVPGKKNTTTGKAQKDSSGNPSGAKYYLPILAKEAKKLGVEMMFKTPMIHLLRDGEGRVFGCIAKNKNGEVVKINAQKGVILCSGGYGRNLEMIERLAPQCLATKINAAHVGNTGDGIISAISIGAAMDPINHEMMIFDRGVMNVRGNKMLGPPWKGGRYLWIGSQPFLRVNVNGNRFVNEDLPYDYGWHAALMQPQKTWWMVWDGNYAEDLAKFRKSGCARIVNSKGAPDSAGIKVVIEAINYQVEKGFIQKAQTIEDLARKMGVSVENFIKTVSRYNEMSKMGKDTDFGKAAFQLSTISKPPYYASLMAGCIICNLNGLRVNTEMCVLDRNLRPIPGLYAAGNDSGSFFAHSYPSLQSGMSLGRAATFGRIAGINAATKTFKKNDNVKENLRN